VAGILLSKDLKQEDRKMDEFHRPTATFPSKAYNATQVRLYGLDGTGLSEGTALNKNVEAGKYKDKTGTERAIDMDFKIKGGAAKNSKEELNCLPVDVKIGLVGIYAFTYEGVIMWPAVIYGYSYEGHCYDLPKPKIMLLPEKPTDIPDDDCGYDKKKPKGYKVWIIDKLDECVEIDINRGFAEQLVLDANMPGRRSPSTYRATMAVSHRNGRLME
jgi:hypothetical protein